jgi:MerR family transcriptional regulator, light-induced transcriptional regulator
MTERDQQEAGLGIGDVAARTGLAAGTIRMWERRYGFPCPDRTPSGYRKYDPQDVETLRRVVALRRRGMSVPAALERARDEAVPVHRPSIFGAVVDGGRLPVRRLCKPTLLALSRAIEDETLARADNPLVIGAFQRERFYRAVEHRYRRLAEVSEHVVALADFRSLSMAAGSPAEVPIDAGQAIGHEWAVIVDAPGLPVCLLAWEQPRREPVADAERTFEAFWTLDPRVVRRAANAAAACAAIHAPDVARALQRTLDDRPLALSEPVPALEGLAARMIDYLEA